MFHRSLPRYTYEPFSQSQNDNPEQELPVRSPLLFCTLSYPCWTFFHHFAAPPLGCSPTLLLPQLYSGDYVLVWGEPDEDGYVEGELLDGRRGLIPTNYVTKLVGEDLMEFHQVELRHQDDSDDDDNHNDNDNG